jgi:hypothetical protein
MLARINNIVTILCVFEYIFMVNCSTDLTETAASCCLISRTETKHAFRTQQSCLTNVWNKLAKIDPLLCYRLNENVGILVNFFYGTTAHT